jgi:uncharacterized RDD family membrane protein YckC
MAAPGITVLKHNVPWGPFTRTQIDEGLARGDFTLLYLAHAPGLTAWLPLGEVLDHVVRREAGPNLPTLPPMPAERDLPALPAPVVPPPMPRDVIAPRQPDAPAVVPAPIPRGPELRTGPIFLRGIALLIDLGILLVPVILLFVLGALSISISGLFHHTSSQAQAEDWALLRQHMWQMGGILAIGCGWLYAAGFEASSAQATIGKQWVGLKVVDEVGGRVTFLRATGRYAAKYLSALPCFLGFIMAVFSSRGRALHDSLAGTRVVRD